MEDVYLWMGPVFGETVDQFVARAQAEVAEGCKKWAIFGEPLEV
jgi:hypothetical protein